MWQTQFLMKFHLGMMEIQSVSGQIWGLFWDVWIIRIVFDFSWKTTKMSFSTDQSKAKRSNYILTLRASDRTTVNWGVFFLAGTQHDFQVCLRIHPDSDGIARRNLVHKFSPAGASGHPGLATVTSRCDATKRGVFVNAGVEQTVRHMENKQVI